MNARMAGELWGLLLRLVVRDGFRAALHGEQPGRSEDGDTRRSMLAASGTARSRGAAPALALPGRLSGKTVRGGTRQRRCNAGGS